MKEYLGIELGSTRIKAVVVDDDGVVVATGAYAWENRALTETIWTYPLEDVHAGVAAAYGACADDYAAKRGGRPTTFAAMGVSAMMHGYLAFDEDMRLLAPFRTWRSTNAVRAGKDLTAAFDFHVPTRWSISQLYQSVLDGEEHVKNIAFQTTLSGYVHYLLTGEKMLGVNDASGMFPIDAKTKTYDAKMVETFRGMSGIDITAIFPSVKCAGELAGHLTVEGAAFLDPSGSLKPGVPLCPPEGDVGTGLVATGAVQPGSGSVSVGTSVFAMLVMEKPLSKAYAEIDVAATPFGDDVALIHVNNGCGELDKWVELFGGDYAALLAEAMEKGDPDCGGIVATNWIAAEPIAGVAKPFPYLTHGAATRLTRANIIRAELHAVFASLRKGLDILQTEGLRIGDLKGHGGLFKTPGPTCAAFQEVVGVPVSVAANAGEGGAWGMARLAALV